MSEDEDDADKSDDEDNANSSSSTPLIDRKRRDNIKRNQERFKQLGLEDTTNEMKKLAKQKTKNTKKKAEKQSKALQAKKVVPSRRAKRGIKYANTNESDEEKSACESTILFQSFVDCYSFTLIFLTKYHYFQ